MFREDTVEQQFFDGFDLDDRRSQAPPRVTKKERILSRFKEGQCDVDRLARDLETSASYVATVLQEAGLLRGYVDLYTTTGVEQNGYSRAFRGVLSFRSVEAARASIAKIDALYRHYERAGDRAGQHHAQVVALTGRNRARWSNKKEEAAVFSDWLASH